MIIFFLVVHGKNVDVEAHGKKSGAEWEAKYLHRFAVCSSRSSVVRVCENCLSLRMIAEREERRKKQPSKYCNNISALSGRDFGANQRWRMFVSRLGFWKSLLSLQAKILIKMSFWEREMDDKSFCAIQVGSFVSLLLVLLQIYSERQNCERISLHSSVVWFWISKKIQTFLLNDSLLEGKLEN